MARSGNSVCAGRWTNKTPNIILHGRFWKCCERGGSLQKRSQQQQHALPLGHHQCATYVSARCDLHIGVTGFHLRTSEPWCATLGAIAPAPRPLPSPRASFDSACAAPHFSLIFLYCSPAMSPAEKALKIRTPRISHRRSSRRNRMSTKAAGTSRKKNHSILFSNLYI